MAIPGTEVMKIGTVSPGEFDQNVLIPRLGMKQETILAPDCVLVCHAQNAKLELVIPIW
jgi:hypothetical protein